MNEQNSDLVSDNDSQNIDAQVEAEIAASLGDMSVEELMEQTSSAAASTTDDAAAAAGQAPDDSVENKVLRGRIVSVAGEDVFVELAGMLGKSQAIVPLQQFDRAPRPGAIMDFVVVREDPAEGIIHLSREGVVSAATWDHLSVGSTVEARVTGSNKGGLELELIGGIRAFMPVSQIDLHHVDDMESFVGQKLEGRVQEINRKGKKVVLSRREYLERRRASAERKLWSELEVGQVREGTVNSLAEYGAFVDIGGIDGLVHISDLSYTRVEKPEEVVKVGDKVQVKVLKLDVDRKRISLGLKQVQPDPWTDIDRRVQAGDQITARVVRTADFGVFVEIEPGVEGLVPQSELTWRRSERPSDVVNVGDMLSLQVMKVEPSRQRLTLSLKQAQGDPWVGAEHKYPRNELVEATVRSITDYGAFAEVERGIEGLVHISELSDRRVNQVTDVLQIGQTEQFRVLEVDEENRRMKLSLKGASEPAPQSSAPAPRPASRRPTRPLKGGLE